MQHIHCVCFVSQDELQKASARAALVDGLQKEVTRLQQFEEDASIQIRALRAEIKEANSQIEDLQLKENIRRSDENGVTDNNVQYSDLQVRGTAMANLRCTPRVC